MSPLTVELTFNGRCFGIFKLPQVKTSFWGTNISVPDQRVQITDMAAYNSFARSVFVDEETTFHLENGKCTIKAIGIVAHCDYCLAIPIKGMGGPKSTLIDVGRTDSEMLFKFRMQNPSPVEIDHGVSYFELRNDQGDVLAKLQGNFKIIRGEFDVLLQGPCKKGVAWAAKARLVGVGAMWKNWCSETVQHLDLPMDIKPEFLEVLQD